MAEKKTKGGFIATGRRKKSVARVRLMPGKGQITINGREIGEYLQRDTLILIAKQPLTLTNTADKFDVVVNVDGGGIFYEFFRRVGITPAQDEVRNLFTVFLEFFLPFLFCHLLFDFPKYFEQTFRFLFSITFHDCFI